jgi:hypothetical protein
VKLHTPTPKHQQLICRCFAIRAPLSYLQCIDRGALSSSHFGSTTGVQGAQCVSKLAISSVWTAGSRVSKAHLDYGSSEVFYRRAKLLFFFGGCDDPLIGGAALIAARSHPAISGPQPASRVHSACQNWPLAHLDYGSSEVFYRRAKLLFFFGGCDDPLISIVAACLLLVLLVDKTLRWTHSPDELWRLCFQRERQPGGAALIL